jgi:GntR family transcriptional regulator
MRFELSISPGSSSPIFRQIVEQVRLAVATGKLSAGDPLPSVRTLAERLIVNHNTIAKAYAELAREGTIETQLGRGVFVAKSRQVYTKSERARRIEPLLDALANGGIAMGYSRDELLDALATKLEKLGLISTVHEGKSS